MSTRLASVTDPRGSPKWTLWDVWKSSGRTTQVRAKRRKLPARHILLGLEKLPRQSYLYCSWLAEPLHRESLLVASRYVRFLGTQPLEIKVLPRWVGHLSCARNNQQFGLGSQPLLQPRRSTARQLRGSVSSGEVPTWIHRKAIAPW